MPKSSSYDLEEGEICDDDEIFIKQSNAGTTSNEVMDSTTKYFHSLHYVDIGSVYPNIRSKISDRSAVSSEIINNNQETINGGGENEVEEDKSGHFNNYEVNGKDYISCSDDKMLNGNESEDLNVENLQDELVEYHSSTDDELDKGNKNNTGFSEEIICDEGITAVKEFYNKMTARNMDAGTKTYENVTIDENKMRKNLVEEVPVDDSWIFHSLGGDTKAVDIIRDEKQMLREKPDSCTEEFDKLKSKFAEEKENYVRNMYSVLVTARAQIESLKKENKKLETKLQGNGTVSCPKCQHQIYKKNNLLKPKYIKVLKGRCAIEMLFDNLPKMEEWLAMNYLDMNPDELPVLLELPRKPTLASTNSILAPKKLKKADEINPTSSSASRNSHNIAACPVVSREGVQPAKAANNSNKHSKKKLSYMMQGKKKQEKISSTISYFSRSKPGKRSLWRKQNGFECRNPSTENRRRSIKF